MPANDKFSSATVIMGAGPTVLAGQTTTGAGHEANEPPSHNNYNPGPSYPVPLALIAANATVWYTWTCPADGNYYFTTRDLTGRMRTNFQSTIRAYTGTALSNLAQMTYLMDQGAGDGYGSDNGASIAFAASNGTVYYLQIDGRNSATGNFWLKWGPYNPQRLGTCSGETVNFDTRATCVGSVTLTGTTADAWFSFGSQPVKPGNYMVAYVDGTPVPQYANAVYPAPQVFPNVTIIDGDFSGFSRWDNTAAYSSGTKVIFLENYADYAPAYATANIPAPDPSAIPPIPITYPYLGGGSCNAPYWACFNSADTIQVVPCNRGLITHPQTGIIGLCLLVNGTAITPPYPSYSLLYYPMDATVLNTSAGFSLTGSGTSWTITFNISNTSDQDWDNTTLTLLNTGGVSGASAALTGFDLPPHATATTGSFTFTATPGQVTATIQLSRNGQVACTLSYPLYPVLALSFTAVGGTSGLNLFERSGCTPHTWVQAVRATTFWPSGSALPASWGNTVNFVFSIASGPATLANDNAANNCIGVANISGSVTIGGMTYNAIKPSIQVTGVVQSVPVQCTLAWNGISLPTFTQTLSIPAA